MRDDIEAALANIEVGQRCRILFACEAGNRAWGFPAAEEASEVRFIYMHPQAWYLTVFPGMESIAMPLPDGLDVSGWELRKALQLFADCDPALFEWLDSPLVYRDEEGLAEQLRSLVPTYFNPVKGLRHYMGLARKMAGQHLQTDAVNLRQLFNTLRPLLAAVWIGKTSTAPPTAMTGLIDAPWIEPGFRDQIAVLQAAQSHLGEDDRTILPAAVRTWIGERFAELYGLATAVQQPALPGPALLDQLLRDLVMG